MLLSMFYSHITVFCIDEVVSCIMFHFLCFVLYSLLYDTVYESEEIEDINEALLPSLIAVLENPPDKDCKVRINVYYSSTLSKEPLIMASTSFNLRDFLRAKKDTYSSIMGSEHCRAPIAHVRLLDKLPETLSTEAISSRSGPKDWNPLEQKYVFQREEGLPPCYCEELTAESRLSFKMPQLFLKNFANILSESIVVWTKRAHLERMRAGNFSSREEAYANGWYEVSIAVGGCNIIATHVEVESSPFNDVLEAWTATSSEPVGGGSREPGAREERSDDREVIKPSSYVTVAVEDRYTSIATHHSTMSLLNFISCSYLHCIIWVVEIGPFAPLWAELTRSITLWSPCLVVTAISTSLRTR